MIRKSTPAADSWSATGPVAEDRLTENLAAPVVRHSAKARRTKLRLLKANIMLVPGALAMCALVLAGQINTTPQEPPSVSSVSLNSSPGKATATSAMSRWLAQDPSPLPSGRVLSWDGFTSSKLTSTTTNTPGSDEIHRFTLASGQGTATAFYDSTVEVRVTTSGITSVIGTPTLLPRLDASDSSAPSADLWPGWRSGTATEAMNSAVAAWATAFTSGDPTTLRLAIGDKSSKRGYVPLSGPEADNVHVTAIATKPTENTAETETPNNVIARVDFDLRWAASKGKNGTDQASSVSYDVLILDASSASPRVVAWGGPGSGPSLRAYQNAVRAALVKGTGTLSGSDSTHETDSDR